MRLDCIVAGKLRFALQLARNVGGAIIRGAVEVWSLDQPEQASGSAESLVLWQLV